MNAHDYSQLISLLPFGKKLPNAIYVYAPTSESLPIALRALVDTLRKREEIGADFNIIKFNNDYSLSFLKYADFFTEPHPILIDSIRVNLASGKIKRLHYATSSNPPILHRKECFLPVGHPDIQRFSRLTAQEEEAGLYVQPRSIGFKRNWENILHEKGLSYSGHELTTVLPGQRVQEASCEVTVHRHRTALARTELSKPIRESLASQVLCEAYTVLDYGCGQGSDAAHLRAMGFAVSAWDPAFFPAAEKVAADFVNLGYVLNVIEDPAERIDVLLDAWSYARRVMVVATLIEGSESYSHVRRHSDGVLTTRDTFQKYFSPAEIQGLIESAIELEAVPLSLGIYAVFRDARDLQALLSRRSRRLIDWQSMSGRLRARAPALRSSKATRVFDSHRELLNHYWETSLRLGRVPGKGEYEREGELQSAIGGNKRAHRMLITQYGSDAFEAACKQRKEDLLVYLALANFRRRIPLKHLDDGLRSDLESHFGTYAKAQDAGLDLLLSLKSHGTLEAAVEGLGFGWWDKDEGHLTIHRSLLDKLPPSLRVFVGCGLRLYGNPENADLVKCHVRSFKLTLLFFKRFDEEAFPELSMRVKIDMPRLDVAVYEHHDGGRQQILFFKERFLAADHPRRMRMELLSRRLTSLGVTRESLGSNDANAPTKDEFFGMLQKLGLGRDLQKTRRIRRSGPSAD